jgi:glutamine synthetase
MILLEYIWLDVNDNFRSKIRVLDDVDLNNIPKWNYDGSSTGQALGEDTEIILNPVYKCRNPFFKSGLGYMCSFLVLCETYNTNNVALDNNYRPKAEKIFDSKKDLKPWYGYEQEYFIINPNTKLPLGFEDENIEPQGKYYCGVGCDRAYGRKIMIEHLKKCYVAGLKISGTNGEVAPGQWEYQIGPVEGIESGDQLLVSRYILERIAEDNNVLISFHPKPLMGNWNGSGCHTNFSTELMRDGTDNKMGLEYILECIDSLRDRKDETLEIYGKYNDKRLTGKHETSSITDFSYGIGTRHTSIRIGNDVYRMKKGYMGIDAQHQI